MKFSSPITTIVASILLTTNVKALWRPSSSAGLTWDYLLGASESTIKASKANVVTLDLEHASSLVPYLHSKGQRAICYFSGGTMEKSRKADYQDYLNAGVQLSETSSWGNHYIDIRNKAKLQPLIRNRMKRALSYGCDAVEVDSLGLYIHHIRNYSQADTITFGKWLAETAHSVGISIGLKNVAGCSQALEPYFDFAVVESCADSPNVCNYYTQFSNHGKAVFIVHYGDRGYSLSGSSLSKLIKEAGNRKFICVISETQSLSRNSINYNCNTGSKVGSSSQPKIDTPTTRKTTTTVKKTTTVKVSAPTVKPIVPNPIKPNPVNPVNKNTTTKQVPSFNSAATKTLPVVSSSKATPTKSLTNPVVPNIPGVQANPAAPGAQVTPGAQANPATPGAQANPAAPGAQAPGAQANPATPGAQANPATPGAQANPAAPGAQAPGVSNVVSGNNGANKEVKENEKQENEGGSGVGTAVAVVAAGGITAAAVAGFVFLKKNKKFSSEKYDLGY